LVPLELPGITFELLELYEDESSSDFEQACIKDRPKNAKVIVGHVFCKKFLLFIFNNNQI